MKEVLHNDVVVGYAKAFQEMRESRDIYLEKLNSCYEAFERACEESFPTVEHGLIALRESLEELLSESFTQGSSLNKEEILSYFMVQGQLYYVKFYLAEHTINDLSFCEITGMDYGLFDRK